MRLIVGIDPSLSCTGVAMGKCLGSLEALSVTSKSRGTDVRNRIERGDDLARAVTDALGEARGALVLIEGYSYGSAHGGEKLGEFGGLLRRRLLGRHQVVEVSPTELKKATTGKGNAGKDAMLLAVERRFPGVASDNNEADAVGLWALGALISGLSVSHLKQASEIAEKINDRVGQLVEPLHFVEVSQDAGSNPAPVIASLAETKEGGR